MGLTTRKDAQISFAVGGWSAVIAAMLALLLCAAVPGRADGVTAVSQAWIQDPWTGESVLTAVREPDQALWDEKQVADYEAALLADYPPPLAVLTIESLGIEVPVYNGTEDRVLDRGAGRIRGTARPGAPGTLGISAHRDSFFRALKDIGAGDEIRLQTVHGVDRYAVTAIDIVTKSDVSVLAQTGGKVIVLVTCFPFYHEGPAPQRYVVTATSIPGGAGP